MISDNVFSETVPAEYPEVISWYNRDNDCFTLQLINTPIIEKGIDRFLTLVYSNNQGRCGNVIGFILKGVHGSILSRYSDFIQSFLLQENTYYYLRDILILTLMLDGSDFENRRGTPSIVSAYGEAINFANKVHQYKLLKEQLYYSDTVSKVPYIHTYIPNTDTYFVIPRMTRKDQLQHKVIDKFLIQLIRKSQDKEEVIGFWFAGLKEVILKDMSESDIKLFTHDYTTIDLATMFSMLVVKRPDIMFNIPEYTRVLRFAEQFGESKLDASLLVPEKELKNDNS